MNVWILVISYLFIGLIIAKPYARNFYIARQEDIRIIQNTKEMPDYRKEVKINNIELDMRWSPAILWGLGLIWPLVVLWAFSFWMCKPHVSKKKKNLPLTPEEEKKLEQELKIGDVNEIN